MPRRTASCITLLATLALATSSVHAATTVDQRRKPPRTGNHHRRQIWHGYGFLPGYRTPERIDLDNARARGPQIWYGGPRWYHGQWNHGGFGPCWTETPIGEIWNCGK